VSAAGRAPANGNLRLFVAVELPTEVRGALSSAIDDLKRAGANEGLRWVRPEGVHLTLKFLGATPPARVDAITEALRQAAAGVAPFGVRPAGFGSFHGGKRHNSEWQRRESYHYNLRVLWVGIGDGADELRSLAERVEGALNPLGFERERNDFFPHLTLARVREDVGRATREQMFRTLEPFLSGGVRTGNFRPELVREFPMFHVKQLALMQSTLQPGGAVYRAVETFALGGEE
jgi:2'-5' RNA ligase